MPLIQCQFTCYKSSMSNFLKLYLVSFLICSLFENLTAQATNYCDLNSCKGKTHIACNNEGNFATICSANAKIIPINSTLSVIIVRRHNVLRNHVALGKLNGFKPAIRMATMSWDNELAKLAELNVKQCKMQHDQCRSTVAFPHAGQNLAFSSWMGMEKNPNDVTVEHLQSWFDEYKAANMNNIDSLKGDSNFKDIGHFTAMMQEKNFRVGCAILRQSRNRFTTQFMACNYAYTNVFGQAVYRSGATASKCTSGINKNFPGLCSEKEKYNVNSMIN